MTETDYGKIRARANELITAGQIKQALAFLADNVEEDLQDEVRHLRSKYHANQDQYEVKMVIDKREYDLAWSRIVNGTQRVVDRIGVRPSIPATKRFLPLLALLLLVVVAVGAFLLLRGNTEVADPPSTEVTAAPHHFVGSWEAKVEHEGYLIDQGRKQRYVNDVANWLIDVFPDNTAVMRGTIDTTGRTRLEWFYSDRDSSLRFIQEDETSFQVRILENEVEQQRWFAERKQGVKQETWNWRLRRVANR